MHIAMGGAQELIGSGNLIPNGFAMLRDRSFLVVNNSADGGIWRISGKSSSAQTEPFLMEVDGRQLVGVNFVLLDNLERLWITITSFLAFSGPIDRRSRDGYIVVVEKGDARVVADGLCWTNECRLHPDGQTLYVIETFGRRLLTYHVGKNGDLSNKKTLVEFEDGDFPDGLTFDTEGAVWVTSVFSNRLIRLTPDLQRQLLIEDADESLAEFETAFQDNVLDRSILHKSKGGNRLWNISSVAFGGPDLRTVYLGCLGGKTIQTFQSPVSGVAPSHWNW